MNPAAEGTVYPDVAFTVDPARVAAFREVFGQTEGVPPTFVTAAEFTVFPQVMGDPNLGLDFTRVVHGSQEYVYERPLREGETLAIRARIDADQDQRRHRVPHRRDGASRRRGPAGLHGPVPDGGARAVTPSVGEQLPEFARVVTAADVAAYAEAGGDRNPLHLDGAFARSVGFDDVIAHGMFTMGHMAAAVSRWAGPDAVVERINAHFRAPVFMGEEIRAGGTVRAVDSEAGSSHGRHLGRASNAKGSPSGRSRRVRSCCAWRICDARLGTQKGGPVGPPFGHRW